MKTKNLFVTIQMLAIVIILASCNGQKNTPENQNVSKPSMSTADSAKSASAATQTSGNQTDEGMTGSQVIDNAVERMSHNLGLAEKQVSSVKDILTKAFVGMGEDLNKKYSMDQSKALSHEIIQKSSASILALLDPGQSEKFKGVVSRNPGNH